MVTTVIISVREYAAEVGRPAPEYMTLDLALFGLKCHFNLVHSGMSEEWSALPGYISRTGIFGGHCHLSWFECGKHATPMSGRDQVSLSNLHTLLLGCRRVDGGTMNLTPVCPCQASYLVVPVGCGLKCQLRVAVDLVAPISDFA